jgi:hypothetical protein
MLREYPGRAASQPGRRTYPPRVRRRRLAAQQPAGDIKPGIVTRAARGTIVMVACGLALLTAGCGSGSGTSPGSTSSTAPSPPAASAAASPSSSVLCADAAALRASLDKLRHVNVGTGMASEIIADLNDVETALATFVTDARSQYQAHTSALSSALATLSTSVSDLAAHPGASTVSGVAAAIGGVSTAGQNLLAAVNTSCLSASPSSSTQVFSPRLATSGAPPRRYTPS